MFDILACKMTETINWLANKYPLFWVYPKKKLKKQPFSLKVLYVRIGQIQSKLHVTWITCGKLWLPLAH